MEYVQQADYSRYHYTHAHDLVLSVISARIHLNFCEQVITLLGQACGDTLDCDSALNQPVFKRELRSVLSFFRNYVPDYVLTIDRAKVHLEEHWGNESYASMRARYDTLIEGKAIMSRWNSSDWSAWLRLFKVLKVEAEELYKSAHNHCATIAPFQLSLSYPHGILDIVQQVDISCGQSITRELEFL